MSGYSPRNSCSPAKAKALRSKSKTCFSYQSLAKIARRFNAANPSQKITISNNRDELWAAIKRRIPECHNERCWINAKWIPYRVQTELVEEFKPPIPKGKNAWLNTDDIDHVIDRYERIFPAFRYIGTYPIDFTDVAPEVLNNLKRWLRSSKIKSIGLILNLDEHDEPGSHWVAVFMDKTRRSFEYFDSFGQSAPEEVNDLFEDVEYYSDKRWKFLENGIVHQLRNSECGVYAIHFIVKRLSGSSFHSVVSDIIRDDEMNAERQTYFDPNFAYDNTI